jgi:hypothetical protein
MRTGQRDFEIRYESLVYVLMELRDAAEFGKDAPYVVSSVCSAVANLILAAGKNWGDTGMTRMMDLVVKYGFHPEYYAASIRVTFISNEKTTT